MALALPAFMTGEDIQCWQASIVGYRSQMEIDLRLMEPALTTPPDEIYVLVPVELIEFGRVTADRDE